MSMLESMITITDPTDMDIQVSPPGKTSLLGSLQIGGTSYTLTPDQYLVPKAQYAPWGLPSGKYT